MNQHVDLSQINGAMFLKKINQKINQKINHWHTESSFTRNVALKELQGVSDLLQGDCISSFPLM